LASGVLSEKICRGREDDPKGRRPAHCRLNARWKDTRAVSRADTVAELERIGALLEEPLRDGALDDARRRLEALRAVLAQADECPFEPGSVRLVGMQYRRATPPPRPKQSTASKKPKQPKKPREPKEPLTGRIAAMVRDGIPAQEIARLYQIKPPHVEAFVAQFVTPVLAQVREASAATVATEAGSGPGA
jgi:hypothetical protein